MKIATKISILFAVCFCTVKANAQLASDQPQKSPAAQVSATPKKVDIINVAAPQTASATLSADASKPKTNVNTAAGTAKAQQQLLSQQGLEPAEKPKTEKKATPVSQQGGNR